jgi:2-oxoglutarate ferredoxin oxidoreductase subunit alpha
MSKILMKGNEAVAEAAIQAGCRFYAGYPITPQNEIPAYMSWRMPQEGGVFIQAESELAAVNLCLGAAVAGARAMTSSSSPGVSLKQEGISYLAGLEVPCVILNMMRGGPGLGNIQPSQSDYFQAVKGGGHGDYRNLVLAPWSVQELWDMTMDAFDLAEEYRNPVLLLADGQLGQMMETLERTPAPDRPRPPRDWVLDGARGRKPRFLRSLLMEEGVLEAHNYDLARKYGRMQKEKRHEMMFTHEADLLLVAFGSAARSCWGAIEMARAEGLRVGLFRPQTLYPFPSEALREAALKVGRVLVAEMNMGQMVEDVRLAVEGKVPVDFFGRPGGAVLTPGEILARVRDALGKGAAS